MFEEQKRDLLTNLDRAHDGYYESAGGKFTGPSFYFHQKSIEAVVEQNLLAFAEYSYAMLCSWGMHRMGPRGAKMLDFGPFRHSLKQVWNRILALGPKTPKMLTLEDWKTLESIFRNIKVMYTPVALIGNSKIMAHALPKLVAPVDGTYTLPYLKLALPQKVAPDWEWKTLQAILRDFYYPVVSHKKFQLKAESWKLRAENRWDTSDLKIADNLVIGLRKVRKSQNNADHKTLLKRSTKREARLASPSV